jgi:hypothetical protein
MYSHGFEYYQIFSMVKAYRLCISGLYNNAAHPVISEGWHFSHMGKTLA